MKVPSTYNQRLEAVIDQHTEQGILPNRYVIHYCDIANELHYFFEDHQLTDKKMLEVGSKTSPLGFLYHSYDMTVVEDRTRFQPFIQANLSAKRLELAKLKQQLASYDVVMVCANYIAERGLPDELYHLNEFLTKNQKFYVLEFSWEALSQPKIAKSNDGVFVNSLAYRHWFNLIRGHMHLGFQTHDLGHIKLHDLSCWY